MAKPIKETPVLQGKDAVRFVDAMKNNTTKPLNPNEVAKMRESFQKVKAISQF